MNSKGDLPKYGENTFIGESLKEILDPMKEETTKHQEGKRNKEEGGRTRKKNRPCLGPDIEETQCTAYSNSSGFLSWTPVRLHEEVACSIRVDLPAQ